MSEQWKPSISIWPFANAPEEFRSLSAWGEQTDSIIFIPCEICEILEQEQWRPMPYALWFLHLNPKRPDIQEWAGGGFGEYTVHLLPDGSKVVITAESERDYLSGKKAIHE